MKDAPIYKEHRIHITRWSSGPWFGMIVKLWQLKAMTKHSLTPTVTRVPGEYASEAEARQAATQYIDDLEGSE